MNINWTAWQNRTKRGHDITEILSVERTASRSMLSRYAASNDFGLCWDRILDVGSSLCREEHIYLLTSAFYGNIRQLENRIRPTHEIYRGLLGVTWSTHKYWCHDLNGEYNLQLAPQRAFCLEVSICNNLEFENGCSTSCTDLVNTVNGILF